MLAAIDRAERHRVRDTPGAPSGEILRHLDIAKGSADARRVYSLLAELEPGTVERSRPHGVPCWTLTRNGRRRLQRALGAGQLPPLPESPQHRAWRQARITAGQEITRLRLSLRDAAAEASDLLDVQADPGPPSDEWFELADRLQRAAWQLGAASHCLYEWAEPDDAEADIDDQDPADDGLDPAERKRLWVRRAGRRHVQQWQNESPGARQ
ncbi:MAG TPA: hypothetical protein VES97_01110 [Solirubrobacteraceae bacterium]|nr:hypothetical protein [Solirubrobacteraceae bacterium]